jgi:hypothetical protein
MYGKVVAHKATDQEKSIELRYGTCSSGISNAGGPVTVGEIETFCPSSHSTTHIFARSDKNVIDEVRVSLFSSHTQQTFRLHRLINYRP